MSILKRIENMEAEVSAINEPKVIIIKIIYSEQRELWETSEVKEQIKAIVEENKRRNPGKPSYQVMVELDGQGNVVDSVNRFRDGHTRP